MLSTPHRHRASQTFSICLPRALLEEIDRAAWLHDESRSGLIRKACERFVMQDQPSRLAVVLRALQAAAEASQTEDPNHTEAMRLRLYRQASKACAELLKTLDEGAKEVTVCEP